MLVAAAPITNFFPRTTEQVTIDFSNPIWEHQEMNQALQKLRQFRDERNWQQFHNPKDLAMALSIEAGELLEAFLWKVPEAANPEKVKGTV